MALTVIDITKEQQDAYDVQYNLAKASGKSDDEAIAIANDARDTVGAQLYKQIATGVIEPINAYRNANGQPYVVTVDLTQTLSPEAIAALEQSQQAKDVSGVSRVASNTSGTIISNINYNLTHECGTTQYVRKFSTMCHGIAAQIALAIRNGINIALEAFGLDPAIGGLAAKIRGITEILKEITYWAKKINSFINDVILVIAQIKALIEYILSLPKKLLALFQKCLKEAYAELSRGLFSLLSTGTDAESLGAETLTSIKELSDQTNALVSETKKVINAPSTIISSITNPATLSSSEKSDLINQLFPDNPSPTEVIGEYGNTGRM